jgi:hypothetical protein
MKGDYNDFLRALGYRESSGLYGIENRYGYLGKYQMGEAALKDAGYYKGDYTKRNDWIGEWTGKDGVWSKEDFLRNPRAQENAIREYHRKVWKYITTLGLHKYVGREIGGILITESGLLGGAHLLGAGNLKKFLKSNGRIVPRDGFGTPITHYIHKFGGYDISEITSKSSKKKKTRTYYNDGFVWDMGTPTGYDDYRVYNDYQNKTKSRTATKTKTRKRRNPFIILWDLLF